ncbi:non-specific lipid transfer protein-like 1 [Oryza brachyantha]|uniref:non-specific lipid transfer protein-like 1 n=1 Tax=Oryza brachyantha TaxID=4533 RepID=UPI001ADA3CE6|nr:non-specific lipid transfer protein-like 1 [Oryza brachyantha]
MSRAAAFVVVLAAVLALACGAASQSAGPAAGPSSDCGSSIAALTGCLGYIKPGSADAKPSKECCAGVKTALASPAAVACLCNALGQDFGIPVNYTRAAALPATCGGDSSALSKCNKKLPGASPTGAPVPSSSGSGSGSTPATGTPSSTKSAATRSPVSATLILATIAATLLSYYYL